MPWAKYGTETTFQFPMIKRGVVDFAQTGDWTPAAADVAVSKDNGNYADGTNAPAIVGGSPTRGVSKFKWTATATELQCAVLEVQIVDAATKAVEDQSFAVYTFGHASAFFKGDWSDIVRLGLTALPNAAADAAGGLPISDAGGLDLDTLLARLDAAISTRSTYAGADTSGTTTLLSRLTSGRAGNLDNLDAAISSIAAAITGLNNLSALANLYGSPLLEIPDSGDPDAGYAFTLVVRDNEGKLIALDGSPTITAANAAGTDRSANLSAVSNPATGRYTFTYSVADDATPESLRITCSGTVSAEARYVEWVGAVVDYDTLTTLLAVKAKTDNLPAAPASTGDVTGARDQVLTRLGTPADTDIATDIAALPTAAEVFTAVVTTALTEAYAADGAAPTLSQALFLIQQHLTEFAISGTTWTTKRLDGSTAAATFTLDDGTNPTSITRAT